MMFRQKRKNKKLYSDLVSDIKAHESIVVGGSNSNHLTNFKTELLQRISNLNDIEILSDEYCDTQDLLFEVRNEMRKRHTLLFEKHYKNITTYNEAVSSEERIKSKVIVINHFENLYNDLNSMILLTKTLIPKIRVTGIVILAIFNTKSLSVNETPLIMPSRFRDYRRAIENISIRIAMNMETEKESELFVGNDDAINIVNENKIIKTNAFFKSENKVLEYKY